MVGIYAEEALTGTSTKRRDDFNKLINDCLNGDIDLIVTKSIARFARNTLDTLRYVRLLKEKGIAMTTIISKLIFGCNNPSDEIKNNKNQSTNLSVEVSKTIGFSSSGSKEDNDLNKEKMLTYAIEDEFLARAEYEVIMREYGEQKPFSNIIKAEEKHISDLKELFSKYNISIPEDKAKDYTAVLESLNEAYKAGVKAEIDNIDMYEKFLKQNLPQDIKDTFTALRDA